MPNNSIHQNLTKEQMLAELRLQLTSPINKDKSFLIIEGQDDLKVMREFLSNNCHIFESYSGKQGVEEIVQKFSDNRLIGIRDKDYLNIPTNTRIFFYDYCNLEMMIISNINYFSNILYKLIINPKDFTPLRDKSLTNILSLSALRKCNEENNWGISLTNIPICKLLSNKNIIELNDLLYIVSKKNNDRTFSKDEQILLSQNIKIVKQELLKYTNGHDFCESLLYEIKRNYPNKMINKIGIDIFHSYLIAAYNYTDFHYTKLFKDLIEYESVNNIKILK